MGCGASQVAADSGSGYAPAAEAPTTRRSVQNDLPEPQIRAVAGHGAEKGSETETNARREIKRQLTQGLSPDAQLKTHVHQEKVSDNAFFSQSELNERRSDRMSATVAQRARRVAAAPGRASREPGAHGPRPRLALPLGLVRLRVVRYCEWVNAEDTSGRKRGRVAKDEPAARLDPGEGQAVEHGRVRGTVHRRGAHATSSSRSSRRVQVAQAISLMGKMEVALGERICTQGEEDAKLMYVVLSGAFDVVVNRARRGGRARNSGAIRRHSAQFGFGAILLKRRPPSQGCCCGEMSLLYNATRTATVEAQVKSIVCHLQPPGVPVRAARHARRRPVRTRRFPSDAQAAARRRRRQTRRGRSACRGR